MFERVAGSLDTDGTISSFTAHLSGTTSANTPAHMPEPVLPLLSRGGLIGLGAAMHRRRKAD